MQKIAQFIFYKIIGWQMVGKFPGHLKQFVVAVVPHTSNVDFFLGVLVRAVLNEPINWIGKKSLFNAPYGWLFRWLGGAPIDRGKKNDTVTATARIFEERDVFRLTIAPEGTRKKVERWKTGFYYIAKAANVPIVLVAFDFGKKQIKFSEPLHTTGIVEEDFETYYSFFKDVKGFRH
ncbi:1-acyl-sn-glycerol-3-phosphate acyltransferase [Euzebyella saccharophila]|uniref:1-acyl-sn-glycerol-3-phosphate acyltransferase n=1 Tax=Euzebyella saccharophila TaxID=679664 RepID=A0ABV8JKL0_9FLAO|nr:1-acyl-sn-glycerol-3-phosphate acyltransferase [Euzebyella saccharophila]